MRHLAIGDIHGCFTALATLASSVPFRPDDRIITLGDYVDRGPDSRSVLDWLIAGERRGAVIPLRGNHELMMLAARSRSPHAFGSWLGSGGKAALASYGADGGEGRLEDIPAEHWSFLADKTRRWYQTEGHVFVHASVYPGLPLDDQPDYMLFWEKFDDPAPLESGKIMVCGHTPQRSGRPLDIGHAICIDTWAYGEGWLTCLDVDSRLYWQANQRGESRLGHLDEADGR